MNARPIPARGPYKELAPIAAALGLPYAGAAELRFSREGFDVVVGLRIDSSSVMGVDLCVARRGWPEIELRRETDDDRAAKQSGMNVEVQTGDPTFDPYVYIESSYSQAVLGPMLQSPELRRAIGELLSTYGTVSIGRDGLTVDTRSGGLHLLDPARFMPLFELLFRVARLFPPLPAGAAKPSERGFGLVLMAVLSVLVGGVSAIVLRNYGAPASAAPRAIGAGIGVVIALVAIPLVKLWVRGHSRSTFYLRATTIGSLIGLPLVGMTAFVAANAFFDPSPPERSSGRVVTAKNYLDDSTPTVDVTIAWSDGRKEALTLHDTKPPTQVGDRAEAVRRSGLFGFVWFEELPTVVPGKH